MHMTEDGFRNHYTNVINQTYRLISYYESWGFDVTKFYNNTHFNLEMLLLRQKVAWGHKFLFCIHSDWGNLFIVNPLMFVEIVNQI